MYKILIVEDEKEAAEHLRELLSRYAERKAEQFSITWHSSSLEMLSDKRAYDLYFLDIEMPGISGMEAANLLRTYNNQAAVIFVTNLAKFAVKGYEVGAAGFIVKPASYGNLSITLDRALRSIKANVGRTLMVAGPDGTRVLALADLLYVEVFGHKLSYHLDSGEILETRGSLGQLEQDLSDAPIVRVSKHCIVNMDKISSLKSSFLLLNTGEQIYFSRGKKQEVISQVTNYLGGIR